jgi:hypothetical protein
MHSTVAGTTVHRRLGIRISHLSIDWSRHQIQYQQSRCQCSMSTIIRFVYQLQVTQNARSKDRRPTSLLWQSIHFGVEYLLNLSVLPSESCDMQNRSKILILLFTATLTVGALTLWHSSNDNEAVDRFRSIFSTNTLYDLKHSLPSATDQASLLYGGISLFAIIMIILILRAARRDSSRGSRNG